MSYNDSTVQVSNRSSTISNNNEYERVYASNMDMIVIDDLSWHTIEVEANNNTDIDSISDITIDIPDGKLLLIFINRY